MISVIPQNTLELKLAFYCANCRSESKLKISIVDSLLRSKISKDGNRFLKENISCKNFDCGHKYQFILYLNKNQYYIDIPQLIEEEADFEFIEDPYYDFYDDQIDAIQSSSSFFDTFLRELNNLKKLNDIEQNDISLDTILKRQIYIASITCLETYLSETFINLTLNDENLLRKFVKTFPAFKNQKFDLSDLFDQADKIRDTAKIVMGDIIFHNMDKVNKMYKSVLGIEFSDLKQLFICVRTRHDLVHRNGKTRDGNSIILNGVVVDNVLNTIEKFVTHVEDQVNKLFKNEKVKSGRGLLEDWDNLSDLPF